MSAPSLHDIAAMPFSASLAAVRTHYDSLWKTGADEGDLPFLVSIEYTILSTKTCVLEIDAACAVSAEKIALAIFKDQADYNDEIVNIDVEAVTQ